MTYGPIDFLALDFKTDQLKGEILPELLELGQKQDRACDRSCHYPEI